MKNNFKIFLFAAFSLIAVGIISCTNDKETFATSNGISLSVVGNTANTPTVLTDATIANGFATFIWTRTDNGTPSESSYLLEISDKDLPESSRVYKSFNNTISGVSPNLRTLTLSVDDMNKLMNDLPSFKCSPMNIDVRIKSILGNTEGSQFIQYSNTISYVIKGYPKSTPLLAFSTSATNLQTAPTLKSTVFDNFSNFEGFLYLPSGSYNFYKPDNCGSYASPTVYGGTGNTLSVGGSAINIATSAYYFIKANLVANTYSIKQYTSFGVIGNATRVGSAFNNFIPMEDAGNKNIWTKTLDLIVGRKFKFQTGIWSGALTTPAPTPVIPTTTPPTTIQNPPFVPNANFTPVSYYGKSTVPGELAEDPSNSATVEITVPGDNTPFSPFNRKSYTLTVDVSNPHAYTYSLKLNP